VLSTLFILHCLVAFITLIQFGVELGVPPHATLFLKPLSWQLNHVEATMGCFVKQISLEGLCIGTVSIRWAVMAFFTLKF
jgi:hypothetical protein